MISARTTFAASRPSVRTAFLSLTVLLALIVTAAESAAQGHRARLSDDLARRLRSGDTTATSVILTASQGRIDAIAARHGLRIRKRLLTGAVVDVPAGALEQVTSDADLDQMSGNHLVRSQLAIVDATIGADLAAAGFAGVPAVTGEGIGVAIIDSGIADVPELRGRVVGTVDFTDDRGRGLDRFGHGTHVAGIVAAAGSARRDVAGGVAPGAHLINLKVLDEEGQGTTGDVIQAIDWAVEHRRRYRIRVLNLSLGGTPMQSWRDDPLCQAVQRAHDAGLVVVASAGNLGTTTDGAQVFGGITVPGVCPHSLTVGALDTKGTPFRSDDEVATFSSRGPTRYDELVKPDLVAPGRHVRSLLAPGSTLAQRYPERVIGSGRAARLELSGTSMAAAVVSGAVALVVDASPRMTPLGVRVLLQYSAERRVGEPLLVSGAGRLNVATALALRYQARIPSIVGEAQAPGRLVFIGLSARPSNGSGEDDPPHSDYLTWGDYVIWGDHIVWGDGARAGAADADAILWGTRAEMILWGTRANMIIWGTKADSILWGTKADSIMWGTGANVILWGTGANAILWGTKADAIMWGTGANVILWGTRADAIMWGTGANMIIWGTRADTILWSDTTTPGSRVVWGDAIVWGSAVN